METVAVAWVDPEGGQGVEPPMKNHNNIGFTCNTGPDPLEITRATKPAFYAIICLPAKRHLNAVSLAGR